jgi:voltage-dependent calcium channel
MPTAPVIGVVVESFSYVFQLVGGTKAITREEMRSFKKVWAEFANPRTGYLEKGNLVPFLGVSYLPAFYAVLT